MGFCQIVLMPHLKIIFHVVLRWNSKTGVNRNRKKGNGHQRQETFLTKTVNTQITTAPKNTETPSDYFQFTYKYTKSMARYGLFESDEEEVSVRSIAK